MELGSTKTERAFRNQFSSSMVILNGSSSVLESSNGRRRELEGGGKEAVGGIFGWH